MYLRPKVCTTWNICFLLLFSICFTKAEQSNITAPNKTNVPKSSSLMNNDNTNITEGKATKNLSLSTEGGNVSIMQKTKLNNSQQIDKTDETHTSREGKGDPDPHVPEKSKTNANSPIDETHRRREGNIDQNSSLVSIDTKNSTSLNSTNTSEHNKTAEMEGSNLAEYEMSRKNDHKHSVPKKEPKYNITEDSPETSSTVAPIIQVNNTIKHSNETINQQATITTNQSLNGSAVNQTKINPPHKKPLLTEAVDDDYASSNFVSSNKADGSKKKLDSVPSLESIGKQKSRSADYVVPIIGIIFSVPLVAIILSMLYKRTAEWWHHRHYRRMDFLIEGMYNN